MNMVPCLFENKKKNKINVSLYKLNMEFLSLLDVYGFFLSRYVCKFGLLTVENNGFQ